MTFTDSIQKIPSKARILGFFAFLGILIVLFIWQVHIPKKTEIKRLEADISALNITIKKNDEKIRRLDELRAEVKSLESRLKLLTEQLPPESEVSGLLRQVQNLVNQSGLVLKLWKPERRRTHASGLYEEIPIILQIEGSYHNVGVLFDKISKLTRIVNILDLKMTAPKLQKNGTVSVNINCTAKTFAAAEKKIEAAPVAKKVQ